MILSLPMYGSMAIFIMNYIAYIYIYIIIYMLVSSRCRCDTVPGLRAIYIYIYIYIYGSRLYIIIWNCYIYYPALVSIMYLKDLLRCNNNRNVVNN